MRHSRKLAGAAYAAPVALFVLVFFVAPLLLVGRMSASDWPLLAGDQGRNFPANYEAIGENRLFWPAVGFTLKYTGIVVVLLLGLSLLLALIVADRRKGTGFFRTAYFLPSTLGLASASLLFFGFYSPAIGPLDPLLDALGLGPVSWLGTPNAALWSTVVLIVWKFAGFFMIILLVGLQSIPPDVYEAARLDGANRWQSFAHITVPLLRPALGLVLILSVTGSLLAFDQFFILTKGGPDGSTMTVVQLIYSFAFESKRDLGMAAALSVIVLVALVIINIVQLKTLRRSPDE